MGANYVITPEIHNIEFNYSPLICEAAAAAAAVRLVRLSFFRYFGSLPFSHVHVFRLLHCADFRFGRVTRDHNIKGRLYFV